MNYYQLLDYELLKNVTNTETEYFHLVINSTSDENSPEFKYYVIYIYYL